MKTMKLLYPLALALAVTFTLTGCQHKPGKITGLPGSNPGQIGEQIPPTLPLGEPINPTDQVKTGGGETASTWDPANMNEDRAALASYTVHFAFDSAAVKSSEQANVQSVASALSADTSSKLVIEGNCDDRGTEEYNRSLGERRALALREALAKVGVDPSRVRTISFGKDKPVDTGHSESAYAKNRRGDFVLYHPKSGA